MSYYDEEADWLTKMEYDSLNRLRGKSDNVMVMLLPQVRYLYDGQGRRVQKNLLGEEVVFLYDIFGNIIFEQREVMTEEGPEVNAVDYIYLGARRVAMVGFPSLHPIGGGVGCSTFGELRGTSLVNWVIYLLPLIWLLSRRLLRGKRYASSGATLISFAILGISILIATRPGWAQNGEEAEGLYFYHNGHLGQPLKITDDSGNIVWQADYEPFGKALFWKPRWIKNNFRFPGQYNDEETGFYYNMNRYYSHDTGRYITPDPILQTGNVFNVNLVNDFIVPNFIGNPDQSHPYVYVTNQPINIIDPLGLKGCCRFWLDVSGQAVALKWGTGTGSSYYRCTDDCPVAKRSGLIRYNCSCYGLALGGGITVSPFSCCSNSSKDLTNSGSQFTIWFINIPTPPLYAVGLSLGFTPGCNAFGTSIGIGVGIGAGKCKCTIL